VAVLVWTAAQTESALPHAEVSLHRTARRGVVVNKINFKNLLKVALVGVLVVAVAITMVPWWAAFLLTMVWGMASAFVWPISE